MHKHLQRNLQMPLGELILKPLKILQGQLTSQDNPFTTQGSGLGHPRGTGDRHLRRTMQG